MSRPELITRRSAATVPALLTVGLLSGCAYALAPVSSVIYGKVRGPITATSQAGPATKTGRACANSVLGIVASGDASIDAAKRAGDITNVVSVDFESTNVLYLYATFCTVVHGT
jgi:hypothetical protein